MITKLDIRRFGFAVGATCAVAYAGCVFVMFTVPHELAVRFFNNLMHGVDLEPIMRWEIPLWQSLLGILQTLLLGWLFGALCAAIYNISIPFAQAATPKGTEDD